MVYNTALVRFLTNDFMKANKPFTSRVTFLWAAGASLFLVIFLWGTWMKGIYALGFNVTVFWLLYIFSPINPIRSTTRQE